ncbi:MAG: 30S ribosomal protein S6 [Micrococcales bacterium]
MHPYEVMVLLDPSIDERTVAPSLDKFLNVIRNGNGTVEKVDIWGRRRLAYEIAKKTEAIYAVINLVANSVDVDELDRQLKLSEAVLRTKVLRADQAIVNIKPVEIPELTAAEIADTKPAKKPAARAAAK